MSCTTTRCSACCQATPYTSMPRPNFHACTRSRRLSALTLPSVANLNVNRNASVHVRHANLHPHPRAKGCGHRGEERRTREGQERRRHKQLVEDNMDWHWLIVPRFAAAAADRKSLKQTVGVISVHAGSLVNCALVGRRLV